MGEHPLPHHLPVSATDMHTYSTTCHFPPKSYTSSYFTEKREQRFDQQGLHPSVHVHNTSNANAVEAEIVTTNEVILYFITFPVTLTLYVYYNCGLEVYS